MSKTDAINAHILRELVRDGRIANLDLAARVGLSPSACLRRVQELERTGVIKGYRAVIDPVRTGASFVAYLSVGLSAHNKVAQLAFERVAAATPQIRECHNITGAAEYLLRIECADLAEYKRIHTDVLGALPHVASLMTNVVIGSPKDERG
jgi:Lrp/AsnC family leucine-responsive transcriptional regulator